MFQGACAWIRREDVFPKLRKTGERFPLDHPRQPSRSPAGRPFRAIG